MQASPSTRTVLKLELIRVRINSKFLHNQPVFDEENDRSRYPVFQIAKEIVCEIRKPCTRWVFSFAR